MNTAFIFDTETTGKTDAVLIEAAWLELNSLSPFRTPTVLLTKSWEHYLQLFIAKNSLQHLSP